MRSAILVTRIASAPCATGDGATRKRTVSYQVSTVMLAIKPGGDVIREVGHPVLVTGRFYHPLSGDREHRLVHRHGGSGLCYPSWAGTIRMPRQRRRACSGSDRQAGIACLTSCYSPYSETCFWKNMKWRKKKLTKWEKVA